MTCQNLKIFRMVVFIRFKFNHALECHTFLSRFIIPLGFSIGLCITFKLVWILPVLLLVSLINFFHMLLYASFFFYMCISHVYISFLSIFQYVKNPYNTWYVKIGKHMIISKDKSSSPICFILMPLEK